MHAVTSLFRESVGLRYHGAAFLYSLIAWGGGLVGLFSSSWLVNAGAVLLLAHGMVIAAYLVHECAHNTVFRRQRDNARLGAFLCWLCGACYGTYEDIRYKHFRHHVDNDDVVWFDYDGWFAANPRLTALIKALEFVYIPAHDLVMHAVMAATSFVIPARRAQRARNVTVLLLRGGAYGALLWWAPRAALLYAVAYLLFMHVLRFMDMLQHDYPYATTLFRPGQAPRRGDTRWEQEHTFSNPLTLRWPRLNVLVLNFGYHNAHHRDMHLPWYRLPALHAQMTGNDPARVIPLRAQLALYHRNRVRRVFNRQPVDYPQGDRYLATARTGRGPIGGNAASFLTAF